MFYFFLYKKKNALVVLNYGCISGDSTCWMQVCVGSGKNSNQNAFQRGENFLNRFYIVLQYKLNN